MNLFKVIKNIIYVLFLFSLIFLLGAGNTIAKPTPLPSQKHTDANIAYNDALSMGKLGVDAGLLAMGVRNLQGASALLKAELTTQNVVRLLLGFGDIATLGLGELCKNDNTEFCKAYRQYEFYVNMGLLSANILNEFPQIYKGLKKGLDNPNLSNKQKKGLRKVLNVEEVGNGVDDVLDAILDGAKAFDDNVLDIAEVGLKNWKTFQNRVSTQLKALYPNSKIGSQITLDVTYIEDGVTKVKTIIPDDLIQIEVNGIKKYKIIDAKTSSKDLVNKTDLTSTCTKNQKKIYPLVDGGGRHNGVTISKVEMRGKNAQDAFGSTLFDKTTGRAQIQLETGVEFWVNSSTTDFTKYVTRPRIK